MNPTVLDSLDAAASGSPDANVAVVRGIPAISVGRSHGGDQYTLSEWADVPSALDATNGLPASDPRRAGASAAGP